MARGLPFVEVEKRVPYETFDILNSLLDVHNNPALRQSLLDALGNHRQITHRHIKERKHPIFEPLDD